ncbi:hypothetical protein ACP3PD_07950 [Enterobacter ludwigii]|uniref:hypothetical protein n=1 Tax=Enterobacter cloacae complex TaxID=354276 RepID=UPI00064D37FF|nr:hypothetical protein [Enterobacter ludwigii]AKM87214.1 hypothetical protein ABT55_11575 [Enterobacter ludwigii]
MSNKQVVDKSIKFVRYHAISFLSFALGVIVVLCFVKSDKYSDSISALANAIMAIAAIMGLVFARKWKRDATKDKVIDKCIKILSVYLFDARKYFVSTMNMSVFKFWFESFTKKEITTYKDVSQMKKMALNYVDSLKKEREIYTELTSDLEYFKLLSWDVKEEHKDLVDKIKKSMNDILNKELELITFIDVIFGMWNMSAYRDDENKGHKDLTFNISKNPIIASALQLIPEIVRLKEDMDKLIEELLNKELNVFSFIEQIEN